MPDFVPSSPEQEQISVILPESNIELTQLSDYSFLSHFETPTDPWSFSFGSSRLADPQDPLKSAMVPGVRIQLRVNGFLQSTGIIDSIEISASKTGGTEYRVEGRDLLGQTVDESANPSHTFKPNTTLAQALAELFGPYGYGAGDILDDAIADREIRSGGVRGKRLTPKKHKVQKDFAIHQLRAKEREGVFEFASRIANRFGLHIWLSGDGQKLIVSQPDFDQQPSYTIRRNTTGTTNVTDGVVRFSVGEQPTIIIAKGYSQNPQFPRGQIIAYARNPSVQVVDSPADVEALFPGIAKIDLPAITNPLTVPRERFLHAHDDTSQTLEQLQYFIKKELATRQRHSITAHYVVEGHGQYVGGYMVPWCVDRTVDVADEVAGLYERMYVVSRTFTKSRRGGTKTKIELIRLNTMAF